MIEEEHYVMKIPVIHMRCDYRRSYGTKRILDTVMNVDIRYELSYYRF